MSFLCVSVSMNDCVSPVAATSSPTDCWDWLLHSPWHFNRLNRCLFIQVIYFSFLLGSITVINVLYMWLHQSTDKYYQTGHLSCLYELLYLIFAVVLISKYMSFHNTRPAPNFRHTKLATSFSYGEYSGLDNINGSKPVNCWYQSIITN